MLMRLRPDLVKLDRSLVESLAEDPAAQTLVESFARLARGIGAEVWADGVEELDDLRALARLDVAYAQGRAVGPPAEGYGRPAVEAAARVARRGAATRERKTSVRPPTAPPQTATPPSPRSSR
jgi:EAL domain-containing protein (putative c-di-GMP-specific phosphodiesterase class I)